MDFIDEFYNTLKNAGRWPEHFIFWSGVALVSAMCGRLVSTNILSGAKSDNLFPNLFVLLVGKPGVGKTTAIVEARNIARVLGINTGPDDVSGEALIGWIKKPNEEEEAALKAKGREAPLAPGVIACFLDEFEHLFHGGNAGTIKRYLTMMYDCRSDGFDRYTYKHGKQQVGETCMTMIGGCTPAHLATSFEPLEWQEGLPSRILYVWGDRPPYREEFTRGDMEGLIVAAQRIMAFIAGVGTIQWTKEATGARVAWEKESYAGLAPHSLLEGYATRKIVNLAKLATVFAVARRSGSIEIGDWDRSVRALSGIEPDMQKALSLAGGNTLKDLEDWLQQWLKDKKSVHEHEVRRVAGRRLDPHMIGAFIEEMIAQKRLLLMDSSSRQAPLRIFKGGSFDKND